jgi:hypothetical protein
VACEGEITEPDYLQYLNDEFGDGDGDQREPFRIQPVYRKNHLSPFQAVEAADQHAGEDEAWALFDCDQHRDIPRAIEEASKRKVELGFSHPSFDLWLLLHFQAFSGAQSGSSGIVIDKLRKVKGVEAFRNFGKSGKNKDVKGARRDALRGREKEAIANARRLVSMCAHGSCKPGGAETKPAARTDDPTSPAQWAARSGHARDCPMLKRDPSTDVWRLLVSLGIGVDDC